MRQAQTHDAQLVLHGETLGTVYLIVGETTGRVKVGWTSGEVNRRLKDMQQGSPDILRVLCSFEGTMQDEKDLHQDVAFYHSHGEWFEEGAIDRLMYLIPTRKRQHAGSAA